jgi:hypothetical protein
VQTKSPLSCVFVPALVVSMWCSSASANLLLNASFETNTGWGGSADYWVNSYEAGTECWAYYTGGWGMAFVTWRGSGSGEFYQDIGVTGNTAYKYTIWTLRDSGTLLGDYWMVIEWYAGSTYLGESSQLLDIPSDNWEQQILRATSPTNADAARVMIAAFDYNIVGKFDDAEFIASPIPPAGVVATGQDCRIDLRWEPEENVDGYNIYCATNLYGSVVRLNSSTLTVPLYSDFCGANGATFYYYVTSVKGALESDPSAWVSATSWQMTDDELLTSVQQATFRYFWDFGHPVSGLIREGYNTGHPSDTCAVGGTGFGLMAICVGAERGFVTRAEAAQRVLQILTFLDEDATRFHGAWSHWVDGATGATLPFSDYDDGGDIVETSYLVQGLLTVRKYFDSATNTVEQEIRSRATAMWEGVDWYWYLRRSDPAYANNEALFWHWSPNYGWAMNIPIYGFNEAMIVYLLAIGSPSHPIPASCYYHAWTASGSYANGNTYYGYLQWVGWDRGGPMFFTHYSCMGFDPRDKNDRFADYFENNRNIALIDRAYCMDNPRGYSNYNGLVWGLTASLNPWGYAAQAPGDMDNGTITPTAALSSMPYAPTQSIATLKYFYHTYGADLWGPFGFADAFNPGQNWFASGCLAIDQGPIVVMIENYRSQLCWNKFMTNSEIQAALDSIGWVRGKRSADTPPATVSGLNYDYYEGSWDALPDFDALTPIASGVVSNFDISPRRSNDCFAFRYTGYIDVPTAGGYTFYTESDDGSRLYIGNTLVVDNDGLHGTQERAGFIALQAGKHAVTATFFEKGGDEVLRVRYAAQGIPKTLIPDSALYRDEPVTLLQDGLETNFVNWTDGGNTDWVRTTAQKHTASYSAQCGSTNNDLISDNLNASGCKGIRIEFWYRDHGVDDADDVYLQLYDGSAYDNRSELGITSSEDIWHKYDLTIRNCGSNGQYFHSQFRIKIEGSSIDSGEYLWIDDVKISKL